ncbi:MAG TPA: hypothetical protein VLT16_13705 [Candidatus Limnocylindrales bacterium]|nr:hypothetical protein [Candidatus Limnocylindrales bacterium]
MLATGRIEFANLATWRAQACPKNMYFTAERRNYFARPSPLGFSYSQAALRGGRVLDL